MATNDLRSSVFKPGAINPNGLGFMSPDQRAGLSGLNGYKIRDLSNPDMARKVADAGDMRNAPVADGSITTDSTTRLRGLADAGDMRNAPVTSGAISRDHTTNASAENFLRSRAAAATSNLSDANLDGLAGVNTSINTSGLDRTKTDLTNIKEDIQAAGNKRVTQEDLDKQASLRPDNESFDKFQNSLNLLEKGATEGFDVDRTIANRLLNRLDGTVAASSIAQAQRAASDPTMSSGAKAAGIAESLRQAGIQRSDLTGQLAQQAQERSFQALNKLVDASFNGAQFEETQFQNDLDQINTEFDRGLNTAIAVGEISVAEAANTYREWETIVNARTNEVRNELDKQIALASNQLEKDALKLQQTATDDALIGTRTARLVNTITANLLDPDTGKRRTTEELLSDPLTVQQASALYSMYSEDEFNPDHPSDQLWFETISKGVKTPSEQGIIDFKDEIGYADMSEEDKTIWDAYIEDTRTISSTGGTVVRNSNGTVSIVDPANPEDVFVTFAKNYETGKWESLELTEAQKTINSIKDPQLRTTTQRAFDAGVDSVESFDEWSISIGASEEDMSKPAYAARRKEVLDAMDIGTDGDSSTSTKDGEVTVSNGKTMIADKDGTPEEYKFDITQGYTAEAEAVINAAPDSIEARKIKNYIVDEAKRTGTVPAGVPTNNPEINKILIPALAVKIDATRNTQGRNSKEYGFSLTLNYMGNDDVFSVQPTQKVLAPLQGRLLTKVGASERRGNDTFYTVKDVNTGETWTLKTSRAGDLSLVK